MAGWFTLKGLETDEEWQIAKPWIQTPIDFQKVKNAMNKCVAIFSDNDPFVPIDNTNIFKEKLGAKIIIEKQKGHFSGSDNITKLPSVLKELLNISK